MKNLKREKLMNMSELMACLANQQKDSQSKLKMKLRKAITFKETLLVFHFRVRQKMATIQKGNL